MLRNRLPPGSACEVPAGSGVVDWQEGARRFDNRHANIDLIEALRGHREFKFVELKKGSENPRAAAAKLIRYALLYLLARAHTPGSFRATRPLLGAERVELAVWAPAQFYSGYDGNRLEQVIAESLRRLSSGLAGNFSFERLDDGGAGATNVDWASSARRQRRITRHVPGPFRSFVKRNLQAAPSPLLFDPNWQGLLDGREHQGFAQPDSSQAFGLNLFAPLSLDPELAKSVLNRLAPGMASGGERISILFEQNNDRAAQLLNERGIATQIDVCWTLAGAAETRYVLVEVKFAEEAFGSCRGWSRADRGGCCRALAAPETNCYLAAQLERRYWQYLQPILRPLQSEICPFRGSLYQLMRNYLTARLYAPGVEARFAVCLHPGNDEVRRLELPVAGEQDAILAFRALLGDEAVSVWNAREIVGYALAAQPLLQPWHDWMMSRYFGGAAPLPSTEPGEV